MYIASIPTKNPPEKTAMLSDLTIKLISQEPRQRRQHTPKENIVS